MRVELSRWMTVCAACLLPLASCSDSDKDKDPRDATTPEARAGDAARPGPDAARPGDGAADGAGSGDAARPGDAQGAALRWYRTCGDPVCRVDEDAGPGACAATVVEGAPCTKAGESCKLPDACGARLQCADKPFDLTNCPISRRRYKRDIAYLDEAEQQRALDALLRLRLARYRVRGAEQHGPRLGFIIDDQVPRETVRADGDSVDVYGYASLIAAAVQAQAKQIAELKAELRALRAARR